MNRRPFVIVAALLVIGLTINWYYRTTINQQASIPDVRTGIVWPEPRPLSGFELSDHRGAVFGRDELLGRWTLMFFGYASCPDICPATMVILRGVTEELAKSGTELPRVVLVSVDPERDDAETLGQYVTYFDKDFLGARGDDAQLLSLASQVGAMYEREPPDENGNYEVVHSASIFLVDPQARLLAVFSPPHKPGNIAERLATIFEQYE